MSRRDKVQAKVENLSAVMYDAVPLDDAFVQSLTDVESDSVRVQELEERLDSALQVTDGRWRFRRFEMTATALYAPDTPSSEEADDLGAMLSGMASASQFWMGDWANLYIHPDMDNIAISRVYIDLSERFGIKHAVLKNYASVCRKLPASLRHDGLPFSHHIEVAKIPHEAAELLDLAAREQWTVRQLRDEVRSHLNKRARRKPVTYRRVQRQLTSLSRDVLRLEGDDRHAMAAALRALADKMEVE